MLVIAFDMDVAMLRRLKSASSRLLQSTSALHHTTTTLAGLCPSVFETSPSAANTFATSQPLQFHQSSSLMYCSCSLVFALSIHELSPESSASAPLADVESRYVPLVELVLTPLPELLAAPCPLPLLRLPLAPTSRYDAGKDVLLSCSAVDVPDRRPFTSRGSLGVGIASVRGRLPGLRICSSSGVASTRDMAAAKGPLLRFGVPAALEE